MVVSSLGANVRLPRLMGDGAILQRDREIPVRGWADAGEKVSVTFAGKTESVVTGADGKWAVSFPAMPAGGPYEIVVSGNNTVTVKDVLLGDVWLCSGQSNMELPMFRLQYRYPEEVAAAKCDAIRQFAVPQEYDFKGPREDLNGGKWVSADSKSVLWFSGVGYFFALRLHEETGAPVGIVNASLGGAPIEAFMSDAALAAFPDSVAEGRRWADAKLVAETEAENARIEKTWAETLQKGDAGLAAKPAWYASDADDSGWAVAPVPCTFSDLAADAPGVVWFRRTVDVPAELAGKTARLNLGTIIQADEAYVNGVRVGNTTYQYPPRRYTIPAGVLKAGKNVVVVRVIATAKDGCFTADKPYEIVAEGRHIDLKGAWKFKVGLTTDAKPATVFVRWKPTGLYNAMIAPLAGTPIKGIAWYQGESNAFEAKNYSAQLESMIGCWRSLFGGKTPFLVVQLPNLGTPETVVNEGSWWARLRDEQRKAVALPDTGLVVTFDLGEWNDIHPENKSDVGARLARAAMKVAYGKAVDAGGPLVRSVTIENGRAVVTFDSGAALVSVGAGELHHFAVAGADGVYRPAHAVLKDGKVIVWSAAVPAPVAVRYAWADNPAGANLYDAEGLPASPFEIKAK
jgi:sialate O-acetylesterase